MVCSRSQVAVVGLVSTPAFDERECLSFPPCFIEYCIFYFIETLVSLLHFNTRHFVTMSSSCSFNEFQVQIDPLVMKTRSSYLTHLTACLRLHEHFDAKWSGA